jgi:hypothetical protein
MTRSQRRCVLSTLVVLVGLLLASLPSTTGTSSIATVSAFDSVRVRRAAPIVMTAPRAVAPGAVIRFAGDVVVKDRKPRTVWLEEYRFGWWQGVAKTRTSRSGIFRFGIQARSATVIREFRARVVAAHGMKGRRTRGMSVDVTPAAVPVGPPTIPGTVTFDSAEGLPALYVGAGSASDWSYLLSQPDQSGSRWNPCAVINWTYNPTGEVYSALADLTRAFARISGASGLKFKYAGPSAHRFLGSFSDFPEGSDIVISWANEREVGNLGGNVVGIGGGAAVETAPGADVAYRMTMGYLTLDNGDSFSIAPGFVGENSWGQVMMHEILHALGLGHAGLPVPVAGSDQQLMYRVLSALNNGFGAGDLTGMTRIGAAPGCLS